MISTRDLNITEVKSCFGCFRNLAFDSAKSKGRRNKNFDIDTLWEEIGIDPYAIDANKILNSKAIRRLQGKTQVFASPMNRHVRTRGVHTDEVVALSKMVSQTLGLNSGLCEAIAFGHDIGHVPFGHLGERVISDLMSNGTGKKVVFRHESFALFVAEEIERSGDGLNLTFETLQGILHHSRGAAELFIDIKVPFEDDVVMICDKIAYIFGDLNDAVRCKFSAAKKVANLAEKLGSKQRERIFRCFRALILESAKEGKISFVNSEEAKIFEEVRQLLYKNVYKDVDRKAQSDALTNVHDFFQKHPELKDCNPALALALMTDLDVINLSNDLMSVPDIFAKEILSAYEIYELIPVLRGKQVNFDNMKLTWQ